MKKSSIFLIVYFVSIFNINLFAAEEFYVGLNGGGGFTRSSSSGKNNSSNYGIEAGYNISPFFAIGLDLKHLTKREDDSTWEMDNNFHETTTPATWKNEYTNNSMFVNIIGKLPITKRNIFYTKLGLGAANYKFTHTTFGESKITNKKTITPSYKAGGGYEFTITKNHSILLEYSYILTPNVKKTSGAVNNEDNIITLGYKYSF
ncbi:MAG: porin family protein [Alphaproteobacteria bacterium]|jgi:opacity protein-like surface antigen|nr:porin family protein [Alphaproteobacteria bacterium]